MSGITLDYVGMVLNRDLFKYKKYFDLETIDNFFHFNNGLLVSFNYICSSVTLFFFFLCSL